MSWEAIKDNWPQLVALVVVCLWLGRIDGKLTEVVKDVDRLYNGAMLPTDTSDKPAKVLLSESGGGGPVDSSEAVKLAAVRDDGERHHESARTTGGTISSQDKPKRRGIARRLSCVSIVPAAVAGFP